MDLKERRTPFRILVGQFTDFMILVLIAAAILSGIIGDLKDTIVIAAIVVLNGVIGFIQEYRAERALEALQEMAAPVAHVIRNGKNVSIPAADLVPRRHRRTGSRRNCSGGSATYRMRTAPDGRGRADWRVASRGKNNSAAARP